MPRRRSLRDIRPATRPRLPGKASRPGHRAGVMNSTEAAYSAHLQARKERGEIQRFWFEPVTLKLATGVRYTPDFMVLENDGLITFRECKGTTGKAGSEKAYHHDGLGKAKVAIAAAKFPFLFYVVFKLRGGAGWAEELVDVEEENQ